MDFIAVKMNDEQAEVYKRMMRGEAYNPTVDMRDVFDQMLRKRPDILIGAFDTATKNVKQLARSHSDLRKKLQRPNLHGVLADFFNPVLLWVNAGCNGFEDKDRSRSFMKNIFTCAEMVTEQIIGMAKDGHDDIILRAIDIALDRTRELHSIEAAKYTNRVETIDIIL